MIRNASEIDIPKIVLLNYELMKHHEQFSPIFESDDSAKELFAEHLKEIMNKATSAVLVYEKEAEIVGYLIAHFQEVKYPVRLKKRCQISDIYVSPAFRHQQIGEQLFNAIKNNAIEKKFDFITLNAAANNPQSVGFWRKMGMEVTLYQMTQFLE